LYTSSWFDVKWQQELGKLLDDVGAVNAALEVYLRLQSWQDVIACYAKLGYQQKVRTLHLNVCAVSFMHC